MSGPFIRPQFISERRWEAYEPAEKQFWHQFGVDLTEAMKQPYFRRLAMVLIDHPNWCGAGADPWRESARDTDREIGRKSVGVQLRIVLQQSAPDLFMRGLNEQMNLNRALEQTQRGAELDKETPDA